MGCINAKRRKEALRKGLDVTPTKRKTYLKNTNESSNGSPLQNARPPAEPLPTITDKQKELIIQSWGKVQQDISKVGVVMFMRLFETHPDVQDVFMPYKGLSQEDLRHSTTLRDHALRVMGTVEKCLARINEPKKLQELLHDLGARHVMYSAKVDYMDLIGPQFIWAIQPAVGYELWTEETEEAWSDLFKFIAHVMKAAMTF
ncbi:hypothetical protein FSP39_024407 [Pinctada imbricata]|uniref:Globin domain-containing protein n=1 Tax=Pinctada imbricata TaxID=66713 RepID=A0AA88Y795_PINIB|nr:hypothetical protein FSP39_024407 [Pinctada imbricata]